MSGRDAAPGSRPRTHAHRAARPGQGGLCRPPRPLPAAAAARAAAAPPLSWTAAAAPPAGGRQRVHASPVRVCGCRPRLQLAPAAARAPAAADARLPVTLVCGFAGAGKTALLRHLLAGAGGLRIAALVSDVTALAQAGGGGSKAASAPQAVLTLPAGCACGALRDSRAVQQVVALAEAGAIDCVVLEAGAAAVPQAVAEAFTGSGGEGAEEGGEGGEEQGAEGGGGEGGDAAQVAAAAVALRGVARLDTLVTVVDAQTFLAEVLAADGLQERGLAAHEADDRTVADVLVEQAEAAHVLVVDKADLVSGEEAAALCALLARLNPGAKVVSTSQGRLEPGEALATRSFSSLGSLQAAPGWVCELAAHEAALRQQGAQAAASGKQQQQEKQQASGASAAERSASHSEASSSGGVSSFVYYAQRPFHPARLLDDALSRTWGGVVRSKGYFWLATRNDVMGLWQSAGGAWQGEPSALWSAALPESERPPGWREAAPGAWHPQWGDRCQRIAWIGVGMDEAGLRAMLDACLLTDAEMALGPDGWAGFEDELPSWYEAEGEHDHEHEEWEEGEEEGSSGGERG